MRVPGETYRVIVSARRHDGALQPQLSSDPPLPDADVLALLFSDVRRDAGQGRRAARAAEPERAADATS